MEIRSNNKAKHRSQKLAFGIFRLADWDTMISNVFAKRVIRYLLNCENDRLPKETMFAFEMYE